MCVPVLMNFDQRLVSVDISLLIKQMTNAVEVDIIVNACARAHCCSFRLYMGHLHHTVLSASLDVKCLNVC